MDYNWRLLAGLRPVIEERDAPETSSVGPRRESTAMRRSDGLVPVHSKSLALFLFTLFAFLLLPPFTFTFPLLAFAVMSLPLAIPLLTLPLSFDRIQYINWCARKEGPVENEKDCGHCNKNCENEEEHNLGSALVPFGINNDSRL